MPLSYFYEDLPGELGAGKASKEPASQKDSESDVMLKRETLELVRGYYQLKNTNVRNRIRELLRAMAEDSSRK